MRPHQNRVRHICPQRGVSYDYIGHIAEVSPAVSVDRDAIVRVPHEGRDQIGNRGECPPVLVDGLGTAPEGGEHLAGLNLVKSRWTQRQRCPAIGQGSLRVPGPLEELSETEMGLRCGLYALNPL